MRSTRRRTRQVRSRRARAAPAAGERSRSQARGAGPVRLARSHDLDDRVDNPSAARPSTSPTTSRTTRRRASASSSGWASARSRPATTSLEALRAVKGARRRELLVVLADDVLRRPRFAGGSAFVVEDADGRAVVDERVEQDRPGVRDDRVRVLEERGELLEIGEARLLEIDACTVAGRPEPCRPSRGRADGAGTAAGSARAHPPPTTPRRRSTKWPS